ncbi:calcium-transporting ATPase, endoplasmic reticulum-type-like isoform X2 [Camellia sinensis]|uniref:calcium-transporting ATPase, endoplasmic reticulum-type-like isoform X2 n=1 Tax=Camellia sinensis TaxID=4442 RepID=UPI0010369FC0|nr:calcium-transporting ATPase, endoplasmic reticulum-type-like isoform X2 [Camellia sinensis]
MTTIGGESVKEEVKLVAVKVSNPCPDMPSLKLQADECDHNTNPIVLWQVMVKKMGLPDGLDFGTSKGYGDVLRCCQTWSKIERRIATLEFDHDRKSMGVIVRSSSGRKSLFVKVYREVFEPLADFCARRVV